MLPGEHVLCLVWLEHPLLLEVPQNPLADLLAGLFHYLQAQLGRLEKLRFPVLALAKNPIKNEGVHVGVGIERSAKSLGKSDRAKR